MWRGAVAVVVGIVALIEAYSNSPHPPPHVPVDFKGPNVLGVLVLRRPVSGWSQTAYDLVRIGGWALILLGAVTVVVGLVSYWRSAPA
jgi:uncharacterized membrane protein HdeD (DUF308 family)